MVVSRLIQLDENGKGNRKIKDYLTTKNKSLQTINAGDCGGKGTSRTIGGNANLYSHYGE